MTNAAAGRQEIYSNRSWSWRPTLFMFAAHCSIVVDSEGPKWRVNKQTALSRTCPSSCWSGEREHWWQKQAAVGAQCDGQCLSPERHSSGSGQLHQTLPRHISRTRSFQNSNNVVSHCSNINSVTAAARKCKCVHTLTTELKHKSKKIEWYCLWTNISIYFFAWMTAK